MHVLIPRKTPLGLSVGRFIFNIGSQFLTCKIIELRDIVRKAIFVPRNYNLPGRENSCGTILNGHFDTLRENQNKNLSPM